MSQVTEQSVRFQTALASIKLIQASAVLDLTEDDFDFLTSNKVWIATDRFFFSSRSRHTSCLSDWSSDVCSSDLNPIAGECLIGGLEADDGLAFGENLPVGIAAVAALDADLATEIHAVGADHDLIGGILHVQRSEERRVGKEGR